jgi:DnaK suppressor protein
MSAATSPSLEAVRQRLDERARQLEQLIASEQVREESGHDVTDLKDGADEEVQAEIESADIGRHLAELRQIEVARARLLSGHYGECIDCAEPIAPARLVAQPAANRCTACQSLRERRN